MSDGSEFGSGVFGAAPWAGLADDGGCEETIVEPGVQRDRWRKMDEGVVGERFERLEPPFPGRARDHVGHEDDPKACVLVEHLTDGGNRSPAWRHGHDNKVGGLERTVGCEVRAWVSVDNDGPGSPGTRPSFDGISDVVGIELGGAEIGM
ncbi:MAG: hypothetical protein ABSG43_09150 [Solirubrobacteraceae bacterium]